MKIRKLITDNSLFHKMITHHLFHNSPFHFNSILLHIPTTIFFIIIHITSHKCPPIFLSIQTAAQTIRSPHLFQQANNIIIIWVLSKLQRLYILKNILKFHRSPSKQLFRSCFILIHTYLRFRTFIMN